MEKPKRFRFNKIILLITYGAVLFAIVYWIDGVWAGARWFFSAISPIFTGLVLAYLFHMPIDFFQHRLMKDWEHNKSYRRLWPGVSMFLGYLSVIVLLLGLVAVVLPRAIESVRTLVSNFSSYLISFETMIDGVLSSLSVSPAMSAIADNVWDNAITQLRDFMGVVASGAFSFTMGFTSGVTDFFLAFIFSIFLLGSRKYVFKSLRAVGEKLIGNKRVEQCAHVLRVSDSVFSSYVMGKLLDGLILGLMCFVCMSILEMEYVPLISVIIGVTELVPIIGPVVGTSICTLLLLVISPSLVIPFLLMICILQVIENYIIFPRIMGNKLGLPGVWVIVSIITGGGLFGLWGMLLGTPVFAVIYKLMGEEWGIKE